MTIRNDVTIDYTLSPRIVTVAQPSVTITIQDLYDTLIDIQSKIYNSVYPVVIKAAGKESLGGGVLVGITSTLQNAKVKFTDRSGPTYVQCSISGGNLVAIDGSGNNMSSIEPSAFTQVTLTSSSSATIAQLEIDHLKYMIESKNITHQGFGDIIFLDPMNGDDANMGAHANMAVKTFNKAQELAVDGAGDTIYIISPGAGQTQINERWNITKSNLIIRGPGRDILLKPTTADLGDTITINATGVELAGFIVEAATGNTLDCGIVVKGKFSKINNMWINRAKNGICYYGGDYHFVTNCDIEKHTNSGIYFEDQGLSIGSPREVTIKNNNIYENALDGIRITGTSSNSTRLNRIFDNRIHNNSGYGINIGTNTQNNIIGPNTFNTNALGDIANSGTNTYDDTKITPQRIWDILITNQNVANSIGKRLVDVLKLKRTRP